VPYWWVDAGMAVMAALLAATAAGAGALFFGIFEREQAVLDALGVPPGHRAVGTIALGVPAADDEPGRSAATRPRRPAADTIHRGRW
jgi:nitroreductase